MKTYDLTKALAISGYMTSLDMEWLARAASEHKLIVEIGSFLGRSTRTMLDNSTATVWALDDWYGPREIQYSEEVRASFFPAFCQNLQEYLDSGRLFCIKGNHEEDLMLDVKPDMVFIDGSHEVEDVKRDILRWQSRILPGGLLCGHDYRWWPKVKQAVDEVLPEAKIDYGIDIWYTVVEGKK